ASAGMNGDCGYDPVLFTIHYSLLTIHYSPSPSRLQQPPRIMLELVLDPPAPELAIGLNPDLGKLRHIFEQLLQDCRDPQPASKRAMDRQREECRLLMLIKKIERLLVHLP